MVPGLVTDRRNERDFFSPLWMSHFLKHKRHLLTWIIEWICTGRVSVSSANQMRNTRAEAGWGNGWEKDCVTSVCWWLVTSVSLSGESLYNSVPRLLPGARGWQMWRGNARTLVTHHQLLLLELFIIWGHCCYQRYSASEVTAHWETRLTISKYNSVHQLFLLFTYYLRSLELLLPETFSISLVSQSAMRRLRFRRRWQCLDWSPITNGVMSCFPECNEQAEIQEVRDEWLISNESKKCDGRDVTGSRGHYPMFDGPIRGQHPGHVMPLSQSEARVPAAELSRPCQ